MIPYLLALKYYRLTVVCENMARSQFDNLRRRSLLASVGTGLFACTIGTTGVTARQDRDNVQATLDNVGVRAWKVIDVDGDEDFSEIGTRNPDLTLQIGVRYTVQNQGWQGHPLAFLAEDGSALLTQSGDGSFDDDSEVDWVDDGTSLSFTVTSDLAEELASYVCTFHPSMEGSVSTVQASDDEAPASVTIPEQSTDGTAVTVDSGRLDDGGFLTIHDSTLLDGEAIGSVRGVSEYIEPGAVSDRTIELNNPLRDDDTLIAMPHRDSNGNESYDFVETGGDEDPPYTQDSGAVTDSADVEVVDATVSFGTQATASPTFVQDEPTTPGVVVDVTATVESAVVITYENNGELVVAGVGRFGADELTTEETVVVSVEDTGGFPGEHVAHAIPARDLSAEYMAGDTVSTETAEAVLDNDGATVHQAELTFDNQTNDAPVESGDTVATVDTALSGDVRYTVDVHVTDDDGGLVAAEWLGSSNVLTGQAQGAKIAAERVPEDGEFNELPFSGTDSFVAMIHLVSDDATAGDSASPGSGPVLLNVDAEDGPVPGGVTASAEVTAEEETTDGATDDDDADSDGDTDEDESMDTGGATETETVQETEDSDEDESSDGSGPGFGSIAGAAGVSSLAAYAYRKLSLEESRKDDDSPEERAE